MASPSSFQTARRALICCFLLAVCAISIAQAGPGHRHDCCPDCGNAVCVPTFEAKKEKRHYWEVECKQICIPHIRWPWQSPCEPPKCGRVKTVNVLKKVEYECEKCGCKWEVKSVGCCPDGSCR
jgi:hypothetical protein